MILSFICINTFYFLLLFAANRNKGFYHAVNLFFYIQAGKQRFIKR